MERFYAHLKPLPSWWKYSRQGCTSAAVRFLLQGAAEHIRWMAVRHSKLQALNAPLTGEGGSRSSGGGRRGAGSDGSPGRGDSGS